MPTRLLSAPAPKTCLPRNPLLNRRVAVRHPARPGLATRVSTSKTRPRRAQIRDISIGGLALILRSPLKTGTELLVQMENDNLEISYDLAARVVHASRKSAGQWIVGCAFARELAPWELEALL